MKIPCKGILTSMVDEAPPRSRNFSSFASSSHAQRATRQARNTSMNPLTIEVFMIKERFYVVLFLTGANNCLQ